jgi:deoxycytidylate deaminase
MIDNIVKIAIKEAEKSNFKHRHGCVIFKNSKIISTGFNEIRHCWKLDRKYKKWVNSLHAEQKAIIFSETSLRRCSLLVVRINKKGNLVNSKPCKLCIGFITDVGISKVYYSDCFGSIRIIKGENECL